MFWPHYSLMTQILSPVSGLFFFLFHIQMFGPTTYQWYPVHENDWQNVLDVGIYQVNIFGKISPLLVALYVWQKYLLLVSRFATSSIVAQSVLSVTQELPPTPSMLNIKSCLAQGHSSTNSLSYLVKREKGSLLKQDRILQPCSLIAFGPGVAIYLNGRVDLLLK